MKRKIFGSTYLLTLVSLFCSALISQGARAQRSSGDGTGGERIVDTTNQGRVTRTDLDKIEADCMFDVVVAMTTPAMRDNGGKEFSPRLTRTTRKGPSAESQFWFIENSFAMYPSLTHRDRCEVKVIAQLSASNNFAKIGDYTMKIKMHPDCLNPELKDDTSNHSFQTLLSEVPAFDYKTQDEWVRNGFGAPVKTGQQLVSEISVYENKPYTVGETAREDDRRTIKAVTNRDVFFEFPKQQFMSCLRDGLNRIGVKPIN